MNLFQDVWQLIVSYRGEIVSGLVVIALVGLVTWLKTESVQFFRSIWRWFTAVAGSLSYHLTLLAHIRSEKPLWEYRKARRRQQRIRPLSIMVMNFKGGVGKTTIAANLAASFSLHRRLKVLLIDLDYQGSLTDLVQDARDREKSNLTKDWLSWRTPPKDIESLVSEVTALANVKLVSASYELTDIEDNIFQRWLLHDEVGGDVRTKIERVLNSRAFLEMGFDLVIFDAPPRLSIASVNALRACNYLLIPSKLQPLSAKPVQQMIDYLEKFKSRLGSDFRILGVVKSMTLNESTVSASESSAVVEIQSALDLLPPPAGVPRRNAQIFRTQIPNRVYFGRPTTAPIAYLLDDNDGRNARTIFDRLAEEVETAIGRDFPVAPRPEAAQTA